MYYDKSIDFTGLDHEVIIQEGTKTYNYLTKFESDSKWRQYVNDMLTKGISVVYDSTADYFIAKPIEKEQQNQIQESMEFSTLKDRLFFGGFSPKKGDDQLMYKFLNESYKTNKNLNSLSDRDLIKLFESFKEKFGEKEILKESKKIPIKKFKKTFFKEAPGDNEEEEDEDTDVEPENQEEDILDPIKKNNEGKELLLDDNLDDEDEDYTDGKEISDEEEEIDDDIDLEGDDLLSIFDEEGEEEIEEPNMEVKPKVVNTQISTETNKYVTNDELQDLVNNILTQKNNTNTPSQINVTDGFVNNTEVVNQATGAPTGNVDVLSTEFGEISSEIQNIENRIEHDESYLEYLEGDGDQTKGGQVTGGVNNPNATGPVGQSAESNDSLEILDAPAEDEDEDLELLNEYGYNSISNEEDEDITSDPISSHMENEFEPNEGGLFTEDDEDILDINTPTEQTGNVPVGGGRAVKIHITGWMIEEEDVKALDEAVRKSGCRLSKLSSDNKQRLNLFVEKDLKTYKITYEDRSKFETLSPWKTSFNESYTSLNKAIIAEIKGKPDTRREKMFKKLIVEDKDIVNRNITNSFRDTDILKEFENTNYVPGWNVKQLGIVNLKTGLNEAFSNITKHTPQAKNTLVKNSKTGQFFLIKGNLNESTNKGVIRELLDLEGKKNYGIVEVVGLYENDLKGLGKVMFLAKQTSIPLFAWKR